MSLADVLPFALLALSLIAVPAMLFVAFRALKRRDESQVVGPPPRHSPRRPKSRAANHRPRFPGR